MYLGTLDLGFCFCIFFLSGDMISPFSSVQFSSVQFSQFSHLVTSNTLWPRGLQHNRPPCPSPTPRVYPNAFHWVGDAIQPSHPLLLPPSIFPSIMVFSNESALCIRWPKYWSFSFNISPSDDFELWCWRRLLRVFWTARISDQSILKEMSSGCSLEGLMLKLKLQ